MGALAPICIAVMLNECCNFWQPEGHPAPGSHSPAKKGKYISAVTLSISLRPSGFKEEAECCALFVYGLGNTSHASFFEVYIFYSIEKKLSCLVYLGRLILFFTLRGYGQTHTNKKCLHGLCPAYIFCGGQKEAGHACCSCSPYTSQAPPATPVRLLGLA